MSDWLRWKKGAMLSTGFGVALPLSYAISIFCSLVITLIIETLGWNPDEQDQENSIFVFMILWTPIAVALMIDALEEILRERRNEKERSHL